MNDRMILRIEKSIARLSDCVSRAKDATVEERASLLVGLAHMRVKLCGLYKVRKSKSCTRCGDKQTLCGSECVNEVRP